MILVTRIEVVVTVVPNGGCSSEELLIEIARCCLFLKWEYIANLKTSFGCGPGLARASLPGIETLERPQPLAMHGPDPVYRPPAYVLYSIRTNIQLK